MQIVINVDEIIYRKSLYLDSEHFSITFEELREIMLSIQNGKVFPIFHGRIIDADEVRAINERFIGYLDDDMIARLNIALEKHTTTLIEERRNKKMQATKCDRCGAFFTDNGGILETKKRGAGFAPNDMDLCEDCFESLKRWVAGFITETETEKNKKESV